MMAENYPMLRGALASAVLCAALAAPAAADGVNIGQYAIVAPSGALTLATGGVSQQLFAANEVVHGCTIQNPSTATEAIWVNFTGAAAVGAAGTTSIQVPAGQTIPCGLGMASSVNWIAATTSHTINAVRF